MTEAHAALSGADFARRIPLTSVEDRSLLLGHANGEPVILVRQGDVVQAVGAICTHYGAPLAEGLLVGDTVRCLWHHACFCVRNGEVLRAEVEFERTIDGNEWAPVPGHGVNMALRQARERTL